MKAPALISLSNRVLLKKDALTSLPSEAEAVAAKQRRFEEVFGGVDWEQARRMIAEAKAVAR